MTTDTDKLIAEIDEKQALIESGLKRIANGEPMSMLQWNSFSVPVLELSSENATLRARLKELEGALSLVEENCEASASSYEDRVEMIKQVARAALKGEGCQHIDFHACDDPRCKYACHKEDKSA